MQIHDYDPTAGHSDRAELTGLADASLPLQHQSALDVPLISPPAPRPSYEMFEGGLGI